MTDATDPLRPSTPEPASFGRPARLLAPGWPCRHCGQRLIDVRYPGQPRKSGIVICPNCDDPNGITR